MRRLALFVLLVTAAVTAAAAGAGGAWAKSQPCWKQVIADWSKNKGEIKGHYAIPCYRTAERKANEDLVQYTDILADIERARLREIRRLGVKDPNDPLRPGHETTDTTTTDTGVSTDTTGSTSTDAPTDTGLDPGVGDPSSVPVPLIVLAGLAGVLLALGGAGYLRRRRRDDTPPWSNGLDARSEEDSEPDGDSTS